MGFQLHRHREAHAPLRRLTWAIRRGALSPPPTRSNSMTRTACRCPSPCAVAAACAWPTAPVLCRALPMTSPAAFDGRKRIWIASMDGSHLRKVASTLTASSGTIESQPAWAPDARYIAYVSWVGMTSDIWVMQADGAYPVRLTSNGAVNTQPAWSPDGRKIVFISDRDGTKDIWLMNADGSQQTKLLALDSQENEPPVLDRQGISLCSLGAMATARC